jgi:hypothetical protein
VPSYPAGIWSFTIAMKQELSMDLKRKPPSGLKWFDNSMIPSLFEVLPRTLKDAKD